MNPHPHRIYSYSNESQTHRLKRSIIKPVVHSIFSESIALLTCPFFFGFPWPHSHAKSEIPVARRRNPPEIRHHWRHVHPKHFHLWGGGDIDVHASIWVIKLAWVQHRCALMSHSISNQNNIEYWKLIITLKHHKSCHFKKAIACNCMFKSSTY